jgi:hypothetical protein
MDLKFTEAEANAAAESWGFNCGPAAIAAICGLSLEQLRPHLGHFESRGYTNPTLMWTILRKLGVYHHVSAGAPGGEQWPLWGLARIQWEGPWTEPGVPIVARYRKTHWVGSNGINRANIGVWDVNCLNNGTGWVSLRDWDRITVPAILRSYPRASGFWHITHAVEIRPER